MSDSPAAASAPGPATGAGTGAASDGERPLLAIGLLLLASGIFTTTDGAAKYLSGNLSAQQIVWVRYGVIVAILLPLVWRRRAERPLITKRPELHILRGLLLTASAMLFLFALRGLPLELCTAIGFVSPLFVTALSIPILGEKVGVRRWTAVVIGFAGVLMILRPGGAAFDVRMLLPIASSFCWALGLIITRFMRASEQPLTILVYSSVVGLVASAPIALPLWQSPTGVEWVLLCGLGVLNALGQYVVIRAYLLASASVLAPFSYSSIVWAVLIGATVFGTFPDAPTLAGTAVLVCAGLYVWYRERTLVVAKIETSQ